MIAAHGNSIRALVKYLDTVSDADITELNIPTGLPLVYELDQALKPINHYYLGDAEEAARKAVAVANQGRGGVIMRLRRGLLSDALPDRRSFLLVFGTAAFLTYTWTLLVSFWNFPSWAFFLTAFQIASIYAYAFLVNFLESVFLTSLALLLRWLLPGRWWKEDFVPLSVMSMPGFVIAINAGYRLYATTSPPGFPLTLQIIFILSVISVLLGLAFTVHKVGLLKHAAINFADRAVIFLYMYLPFTALGLVLIAVRTIISPA